MKKKKFKQERDEIQERSEMLWEQESRKRSKKKTIKNKEEHETKMRKFRNNVVDKRKKVN